MRSGWFRDSYRHSLASRGVRTSIYLRKKRVPIQFEVPARGTIYPITPDDAKDALTRNGKTSNGITAITFANPRNKHQKDAWAQYVRSKREIKVFAQPKHEVNPHVHHGVKGHILDHEFGHHDALYHKKITDPDVRIAEARAEAYAAGGDVRDAQFVQRFLR